VNRFWDDWRLNIQNRNLLSTLTNLLALQSRGYRTAFCPLPEKNGEKIRWLHTETPSKRWLKLPRRGTLKLECTTIYDNFRSECLLIVVTLSNMTLMNSNVPWSTGNPNRKQSISLNLTFRSRHDWSLHNYKTVIPCLHSLKAASFAISVRPPIVLAVSGLAWVHSFGVQLPKRVSLAAFSLALTLLS